MLLLTGPIKHHVLPKPKAINDTPTGVLSVHAKIIWETPTHSIATKHNNLNVVNYLVNECGVNKNDANDTGKTAV